MHQYLIISSILDCNDDSSNAMTVLNGCR